jgi:hypothetical protein
MQVAAQSKVTHLLGLRVRIPPGHVCLWWVLCVVRFCATGWLLVQRSPTECGVSECDCESSIVRRPWPTMGCFPGLAYPDYKPTAWVLHHPAWFSWYLASLTCASSLTFLLVVSAGRELEHHSQAVSRDRPFLISVSAGLLQYLNKFYDVHLYQLHSVIS